MKVTFPESEPAGFKADSVFKIINYPAAWIASASGQAYVNKGAVLFKFFNFHDDVRIVVDIAKSRGSDYLDRGDRCAARAGIASSCLKISPSLPRGLLLLRAVAGEHDHGAVWISQRR
jgi:hypothetical protein